MNGFINLKLFSLDHLSIGSRRSGSYNGENAIDIWEGVEVDPAVGDWARGASPGDTFNLGAGLFLTCQRPD